MSRQFGTIQKPTHAGEIRQSQLITSFGIGSVVDFVNDTVIIGGVDKWEEDDSYENRKLFNRNLQAITGVDYFLAPKTANNAFFKKSQDIESFIFPRKLYCPICKNIIDAREVRNQQKKHNCFLPNPNREGRACGGHLVASRFVIACANGHLEDFPYSWWVHRGKQCAKGSGNRIKMYNIDNRSDIDSLLVECVECNDKRQMAPAFAKNAFSGENGYSCHGIHPHLCEDYHSECNELVSARLRSSSSVYFSATQSALTIPPWSRKAVQLIEANYVDLQYLEQYGQNAVEQRIRDKVLPKARPPITFSDLLNAYNMIKNHEHSSKMQTEADVFSAEYEVLCRGKAVDDEYVASSAEIPDGFQDIFESITVVDKLTVINALIGFTRINPWDGDLTNRQLAPLSKKKKKWYPAVKMLGEGVFFRFSRKMLSEWKARIGCKYNLMTSEFHESYLRNPRFSPQYVALHTFAHLLIRQMADDCGYSASSLKEKIYSTYVDDPERPEMHGVLIYLATSDAEGSLGGLISIAKDSERLQAVLRNMVHKAKWCSADPLCANSTQQGFHSLNYAACHDCVLLPETSCEFRNVLLDRIAIVGLPDHPEMGLMGDIDII